MSIYLSAAAHAADNKTQCPGKCSENTHCNQYMDIVERRLKECGAVVLRGNPSLTGEKAMVSRVKEANAAGVRVYYVAHSNAGGGRYSMTMCWTSAESLAYAEILHKYRKCIKSHKVVTNTSLYEIKQTKMICLYDELFFHDSAEDCAWFHNGGMEELAEETVKALCEIDGVTYKPPKNDGDAVKALEKTVETLEKTVEQLRTENGALKSTVSSLEGKIKNAKNALK